MLGRLWDRARRHPLGTALLVGSACAVPSVVYACWSPSLIVDDWSLAAATRFGRYSTFITAERPVARLWFLAGYFTLDASPVAHALLMGALNAVTGALVWLVAREVLPRRSAVLATAAWVVLANRGATRLWAPTGGQMLALAGLLAALLLARTGSPTVRRHLGVIAVVTTCVLAYEGTVGLAAGIVAVSTWRWADGRRWVGLGAGAVALGSAALWALSQSAKTGDAFAHAGRWFSALVGNGILPSALAPLGVVFVGVVAWSAATVVLPSFPTREEERVVLVGAVVTALGVIPFVVAGFPVATDGIFDRVVVYADLGLAVVIAGTLGLLWRALPPRAALAAAALVLAVLASENAVDVRAFHDAGVDGRRLLASVDRLPEQVRTRGPLVLPDLPNRSGVSMFVEDYDISAALAMRYDTGVPYPDVTMALVADRLSRRARTSSPTTSPPR